MGIHMANEPVTKYDRWKEIHQPYELSYHRHGNFRWRDNEWQDQWNKVLSDFMELNSDSFQLADVLVDVGCGSRPCFDWFSHGEKHYIDPLLDSFVTIPKMAPYWSGKHNLHAKPAEELVPSLVDRCVYTHCWNVLDHTYDWRQVIKNMILYTKSGGLCLIGTDLGTKESKGHPGIDDPSAFFRLVNDNFHVVKKTSGFVHRQVALKLIKKANPVITA